MSRSADNDTARAERWREIGRVMSDDAGWRIGVQSLALEIHAAAERLTPPRLRDFADEMTDHLHDDLAASDDGEGFNDHRGRRGRSCLRPASGRAGPCGRLPRNRRDGVVSAALAHARAPCRKTPSVRPVLSRAHAIPFVNATKAPRPRRRPFPPKSNAKRNYQTLVIGLSPLTPLRNLRLGLLQLPLVAGECRAVHPCRLTGNGIAQLSASTKPEAQLCGGVILPPPAAYRLTRIGGRTSAFATNEPIPDAQELPDRRPQAQ